MRHLGIVIGAAFLAALGAGTAAGQSVGNIANVEFRLDERVFTVMCALHVAGYNWELDKEAPDSARARIVRELETAPVQTALRERLRDFYRVHNVELDAFAQGSKYGAFALLLGPPPGFALRDRDRLPGAAVSNLVGFEQLLRPFYKEARIRDLWLKWQAELGREQLGQHDAMKDAIHAAIDYSRVPAQLYLNRRLVLIPDLVNAPGILNAVHAEGTYYIVASPARDWDRYRTFFVHEYVHLLLDPLLAPLAEDYDLSVELRRCLGARLVPAAVLDAPSRAVAESLVNAVQAAVMARLDPGRPADGQRPDSPFQRYFREHLAPFPASGQPLTEFVAALLAKSSPDVLCAYPHDAPAPPAPPAPVAAPAAPAPPDARESALREAERLLTEGRTLEAEAKLQAVLAAHPDDASALFGMGQALYARGDWTGALGYYARTLEQPDLPVWIRGWSLVKTGHSLVRLNRIEDARRAYAKAAALTGDDRDAAAAARRALTSLDDEN